MLRSLLAAFFIFSVSTLFAQKKAKVNWIPFHELEAKYNADPKPIIIDLYTDWCGWCKRMEKDTYGNDSVANYINKNFYAVKYDAESKEPLTINGKTFNYNKDYKVNEVAIALTSGNLAYPQTIFLDKLTNPPAPLAGYKTVKEIEGPLKFFGEKAFMAMSFQDFMQKKAMNW